MIQSLDPRLANAPTFTIFRGDTPLGNHKGIKDRDNIGNFIDFLYPQNIAVGDIIVDISGNKYIVNGIDQPGKVGGFSSSRYFKVYYKPQSQPQNPLVNNIVNINNTNSMVIENNIDISATVETVQTNINNMSSLSDEETKLALEKVNELVEIIKSKENRKSKWSKVASVFKWLAEKSVDLACAFSPLIIQSLSALK